MTNLRNRTLMLKAILGLLTSIFPFSFAHAACPNTAANETDLDCPWAEITRATTGLDATTQSKEIVATFQKQAPAFLKQLKHDKKTKGLLDLWGVSRNADESHLNDFIVPTNILSVFANELAITPFDPNFKYGNAGLNHTYGYLFSNLQTPFGYKRARYVKSEIEKGFGLTPGLFGGSPKKGTLLSNFTFFIGSIAFKNRPFTVTAIPKEIARFDYRKLKYNRLIETVQTDKGKVQFRTDIVPFNIVPPNATKDSNVALLIYSIDEGNGPKLITAFPVQESFGAGLFKPELMGDQVTITIKYNGWLKSTTPTAWIGKREKVEIK